MPANAMLMLRILLPLTQREVSAFYSEVFPFVPGPIKGSGGSAWPFFSASLMRPWGQREKGGSLQEGSRYAGWLYVLPLGPAPLPEELWCE